MITAMMLPRQFETYGEMNALAAITLGVDDKCYSIFWAWMNEQLNVDMDGFVMRVLHTLSAFREGLS